MASPFAYEMNVFMSTEARKTSGRNNNANAISTAQRDLQATPKTITTTTTNDDIWIQNSD